jgi:hypothetical protein
MYACNIVFELLLYTLNLTCPTDHVKLAPCHHGKARPQVAGGGLLYIWRVTANTFNKQARRADKGWSSSLVVEWGLTSPCRKKKTEFYKMLHSISDLEGFSGTT